MVGKNNIRLAKRGDEDRIYTIHKDSICKICSAKYPKEVTQGWMANRTPEGYLEAIENNEMFVVERDGRILGFGHSIPGEIVGIFVAPEYKGTGVGKVLFKKALEIASKGVERIKLEATLNAVSFYEQFGFEKKEKFRTPKGTSQVELVLMEYYL